MNEVPESDQNKMTWRKSENMVEPYRQQNTKQGEALEVIWRGDDLNNERERDQYDRLCWQYGFTSTLLNQNVRK